MQRVPEAALPLVKSPTVIDEIRPEGQVRTSFPAGGSRIRTLGPPATVELGAAGGARRDRCHPGTPIVRVKELGERFPHAWRAFHMTKAGVELEIGFRDFEHLAVPFFAFSATFEICRDDRICHNLNFRRLRLRGMTGARDECVLAATAQNLRKLVKLIGSSPPAPAPACV
jgi:hypothetical protein